MRSRYFILTSWLCAMLTLPLPVLGMASPGDTTSLTQDARSIVHVEPVRVNCPVGTTPRLPYQIWVTYSDGFSEYRQTRWSNSARTVEEDQANPETHPVGDAYSIDGFIIGDNSTPAGYPIMAHIQVVAGAQQVPSNTPVAEPVPLNKVTLTGDNRLTSNRDMAIREIISWDISQQLYNYRDTYGLSTEGYTVADGWDSPTTKLKGHGSGHYMSALAFAFASTTDPGQKELLRARMTRMVNELRECQERTFVWDEELGRYREARDFAPEDELREMKGGWQDFEHHKQEWQKYGYGYLNAIPAHHPALLEMYRAYNNESWIWAPYYSIHKQLAGLIDIATYMDDPKVAAKALLIAKDMGLWIWNRLHYRTFMETEGTQEGRRAKPGNRYEMWNMYIAGEDGGTGESLARLSEMVSNPEEKARLLEASVFFDSPAFYDPLARNIDEIRTRHANQHIPKITSALRSFRGNNDPGYFHLSQNFWEMIQGRYRYATGGVGNGEMFRQPYTQMLSMVTNPSPTLNETCCAYNLAKLTKDLNCFNPDDARYMDYYERLLYNQIVGSLHHSCYMTTYHYAVGLNASKPWGNNTPQSTCCGGTGSENHVKYQEAAYFVSEQTLWVSLYLPTAFQWDEEGVTIRQDCLWPAEHSEIRVAHGSAVFAMKLRVPFWATKGFDIRLNGQSIASTYSPSSYVTIPARLWSESDRVEVVMPFSKHIDYGPDKLEATSLAGGQPVTASEPMWAGTLMYGPLAMTASGIDNWEEALLTIDSYLDNVLLNGPDGGTTGTDGNLYSLTVGNRTFVPDYYSDEHATHYFRIHIVDEMTTAFSEMLLQKIEDTAIFQPLNYSTSSMEALRKEIDCGREMIASGNATQREMVDQITAIDNSIHNLQPVRLEQDRLSQLLDEAASRKKADYTWDSYQTLQRVMVTAREVMTTALSQLAVDKQILSLRKAVDELVKSSSVDKSALGEVISLALERMKAQDAWNALDVKVPEYAPWAPFAYRRLLHEHGEAQRVYANIDRNYNQQEVNQTAAALNAIINSMRPGNLPEPEELSPLTRLLRQAERVSPDELTPALSEAVSHAHMVVSYVKEGSGTHDMILKATAQLSILLD